MYYLQSIELKCLRKPVLVPGCSCQIYAFGAAPSQHSNTDKRIVSIDTNPGYVKLIQNLSHHRCNGSFITKVDTKIGNISCKTIMSAQ